MKRHTLHEHMTPGRRLWLERLSKDGPAKRPKGCVGYQCMRLGWTEWDYRRSDGSPITAARARVEFGEQWWGSVQSGALERITDAGRQALSGSKEK